ncbi:MAG: ABC transporter ATP-binding protein [Acidobacteriota bacterium]
MLRADNVTYVHRTARAPVAGSRRGAGLSGSADFRPLPGVQQVSVSIDRGGSVALLGPNGSGKTTLLRLLAGLIKPQSGRVTLDGLDVAAIGRRELARRLAVVPQETHLAFDFTVLEVALMGRHPHLGAFELEGPRDLAIAREALDATGTAHLGDRVFATLSGGEKQRVVIASALAQQAGVLLLDEPTASLDLGYQLEIGALVSRLNLERGLTVVVATHDLNFAASLCRALVLIRDGHVQAAGPTEDTLTADRIRALYGVTAEVHFHQAAGHLTVVPLGKATHA